MNVRDRDNRRDVLNVRHLFVPKFLGSLPNMTSRYRVEYALKIHRRDEFIEWVKGLLACPFVLHSDVENYPELDGNTEGQSQSGETQEGIIAMECQKRYLEILSDVERLIDHTIALDELNGEVKGNVSKSRLRKLVPSVGKFFTPLPLTEAFLIEDERRQISKRRLVSPSFNDIRVILNTAQILALSRNYKSKDSNSARLKLVTFDGDVTLYEDGKSITNDSPVISRLISLLSMDIYVAVVTAAGYPGQAGAQKYYERLHGLIDEIRVSTKLTDQQRENLLIMGGESNYLFRLQNDGNFKFIEGDEWYLPIMKNWNKRAIELIVQKMFDHISKLQRKFNLTEGTSIVRKERSIGIIPNPGFKILREQLEEIVLSCSTKLSEVLQAFNSVLYEDIKSKNSNSEVPDEDIRVCAFNGGSDVWVDIGDKSLGVESLQKYLCRDMNDKLICPIRKSESLHIGDQFASVGANDYKARLSACTAWITSPSETVAILDDLISNLLN